MSILQRRQRVPARTAATVCAVALLVSACGGDDENVGAPGSSPTLSPTQSLSPTTTARPNEETVTCTNEEVGFAVAYPATWHTNDGTVAPTCSHFDPEPVTLTEGTEPDTAISLYRTGTNYRQVVDSFDDPLSSDSALIDGREAVAVTDRSTGEGAAPADTISYVWVVDLGGRPLLGITQQGPDRDYTRNTEVLDLIMTSLDFTADDADPATVARLGTDPAYRVTAAVEAGQVCLRARTEGRTGAPTCLDATPLFGSLVVADLAVPGGGSVVAGLSDPAITRVLAGTKDAGTAGFRPTDVPGVSSQAWVVPLDPDDLATVIGYTPDRRIEIALDGDGNRSEVLGGVTDVPKEAPPSAQLRLLTGVDPGLHAGYDRVVFRFRGDTPGFEVGYADRPIQADGSGEDLAIAGDAVLLVRMQQASGRTRDDAADRTYTGPTQWDFPAGFAITEVVQVGDFEGVLTWAVGLRERLPFRVDASGDNLVLDVRHPNSDRRVSRTD